MVIIGSTNYDIFHHRPMHNIFNHLLAGLCLGDLIFLLCNLLVVPIAFGRDDYIFNLINPIAECGCHLSLAVSIFLTVSITVERFQVKTSSYSNDVFCVTILIYVGCLLPSQLLL